MASFPVKLMVSAAALAFALAAAVPASATQARKHGSQRKHVARAATMTAKSSDRGAGLFPAGPVYHANDYLGDDPDPFIRLMIQRDLGAHYGGEP
ncbi:MAG: hypothetical protein ACRECA_06530 [Pseudolabrys sp.]